MTKIEQILAEITQEPNIEIEQEEPITTSIINILSAMQQAATEFADWVRTEHWLPNKRLDNWWKEYYNYYGEGLQVTETSKVVYKTTIELFDQWNNETK